MCAKISLICTNSFMLISLFLSLLLLQPKVVTDVEDEELRTQMEELRQANLEVAGDDDASDDEAAGDNDHITPPITQD